MLAVKRRMVLVIIFDDWIVDVVAVGLDRLLIKTQFLFTFYRLLQVLVFMESDSNQFSILHSAKISFLMLQRILDILIRHLGHVQSTSVWLLTFIHPSLSENLTYLDFISFNILFKLTTQFSLRRLSLTYSFILFQCLKNSTFSIRRLIFIESVFALI